MRNSRWDDEPVRDKQGAKPKLAALTDRDIDGILYCRSRGIGICRSITFHAFAGGSLDYMVNRLNLLSRRPNLFVRRPSQQRASAAANHRRLIYELTDKGMDVVRTRGWVIERVRFTSNFAHELMTCQIMASFDLGAQDTGVRLIRWNDILNSKSLPGETRQSPKPLCDPREPDHRWPTEWDMRCIVADGNTLWHRAKQRSDRRYHIFFCPGVEADCGTEPVDTSDFAAVVDL